MYNKYNDSLELKNSRLRLCLLYQYLTRVVGFLQRCLCYCYTLWSLFSRDL